MGKKYFVTGVTGAVGSALIPLLLENQNSLVWALMRGDSDEHLKTRLDELIAFWEMDEEQAQDARRRIILLSGDTDLPQFALQEDIYRHIAKQCTHIIHCAGVVRMNLPLDEARRHALFSAQNIVELALACQASGSLRKIEYVSTVGVAGRMPGIVPEVWITQPRDFHNTYEQSKAEAEDYLFEQIQRYDLPVTIHRPSMVVGDSKTGKIIHFQIFYYLCEFLSGRKTFGILPCLGVAALDTVPVDYVTEAIKWSADQEKNTAGKVFHLCSGPEKSIRLTDLRRIVRAMMQAHGVKLPSIVSVPSAFFTLLLRWMTPWVSDAVKRSLTALPIFIDYLADKQLFDNKQTENCFKTQSGPLLLAADTYISNVFGKYISARMQ